MYVTMDLRLIFLMIWEMKKKQTAIERKHSNLLAYTIYYPIDYCRKKI